MQVLAVPAFVSPVGDDDKDIKFVYKRSTVEKIVNIPLCRLAKGGTSAKRSCDSRNGGSPWGVGLKKGVAVESGDAKSNETVVKVVSALFLAYSLSASYK